MTLGELIKHLEKFSPDQPVPIGFGSPYLYHGYPGCLSFRMRRNTTVGEMLHEAESAVGKHFVGVAESDCVISEWNDCFFDESGEYIYNPITAVFYVGGLCP